MNAMKDQRFSESEDHSIQLIKVSVKQMQRLLILTLSTLNWLKLFELNVF